MRKVNLNKYEIRTDLISDIKNETNIKDIKEELYEENGITVSKIEINNKTSKQINKKVGDYITISFKDITDKDNFNKTKEVLTKELKNIFIKEKIDKLDNILVIGLGNPLSTPDSLGPKVIDNVVSTRHIYLLTNSLEKGYKTVSKISPDVMGKTGIETIDIINGVIEKISPKALIIIDSLASSSVKRLAKTIQITNSGINPGSGIGNNRKELSKDTTGIPTIAIGVPLVVDSSTICSDTIDLVLKNFSYELYGKKNKIIPEEKQNFSNKNNKELSKEEKEFFLGQVGTLTEEEKKELLASILDKANYNLMVTTKDIDFLVEKLSQLIGDAINNSLHS